MERIKELARQLAERFGTADPFALCAALDITVLPVGLPPGVKGFYGCVRGARVLYLNGALEENERRTVCAHELGHALLHEGHNALFLRERTDFVMERYEREADLFAALLLLPEEAWPPAAAGSGMWRPGGRHSLPPRLAELLSREAGT